MGRKIKRVALDFSWPLREVWQGYINPYYTAVGCWDCDKTGLAPVAKLWGDKWYGNASFHPSETGSTSFSPNDPYIRAINLRKLERSDSLDWWINWLGATNLDQAVYLESVRMCQMWNSQWCHHLSQEDVQVLFEESRLHNYGGGEPKSCPIAYELNRAYLVGFGHDSLNQYICLEARAKRLGFELKCTTCKGDGSIWPSPEDRQRYDDWQKEEPPEGEGWQVWETVSDGSPVSPVFATAEGLENWLIGEGYSEGAAEQFVQSGWVPTMASVGGQLYNDIEAMNMPRGEE